MADLVQNSESAENLEEFTQGYRVVSMQHAVDYSMEELFRSSPEWEEDASAMFWKRVDNG